MDILFKNAYILVRQDDGYNVLEGAYLGVKGEKIAYIGFDEPSDSYAQVKDMRGKMLMPGLVNAHGHSAMTLVRGVGSGLPLNRWLNEAVFPIELASHSGMHQFYKRNERICSDKSGGYK